MNIKDDNLTWRRLDTKDDNKQYLSGKDNERYTQKDYPFIQKDLLNKYKSISNNIIQEKELINIITRNNYNENMILTEILHRFFNKDKNYMKNKTLNFIPYKEKNGIMKNVYYLKEENKQMDKILTKDKKTYRYDEEDINQINNTDYYPKRFSNFNKIIDDFRNEKLKEEITLKKNKKDKKKKKLDFFNNKNDNNYNNLQKTETEDEKRNNKIFQKESVIQINFIQSNKKNKKLYNELSVSSQNNISINAIKKTNSNKNLNSNSNNNKEKINQKNFQQYINNNFFQKKNNNLPINNNNITKNITRRNFVNNNIYPYNNFTFFNNLNYKLSSNNFQNIGFRIPCYVSINNNSFNHNPFYNNINNQNYVCNKYLYSLYLRQLLQMNYQNNNPVMIAVNPMINNYWAQNVNKNIIQNFNKMQNKK